MFDSEVLPSVPQYDPDSQSGTTPGLHSSGNLSVDEWLSTLYVACDRGERLLPLPPLAPPSTVMSKNSNRLSGRRRSRWSLWRSAVGIAAGLGWLYNARYGRPFRAGAPVPLSEMSTHHREAWSGILKEARRLREARRVSSEPTGGAALASLLKASLTEYITVKPSSTYVDPVSDLIAEPSRPSQCVDLLEALPSSLAQHYSQESSVLLNGGTDEAEINALSLLASKPDGDRREYVKYLNRPDIRCMWTFCAEGSQKASCSFKTVLKKNGVQQRKILPTLEANYKWGPPPATGIWACGVGLRWVLLFLKRTV